MATKKLNRKETNQEVQNTSSKSVEIKFIDVNLIIPNPLNPRKYFDADSLKELETSIANDGMLQAIKVRKKNVENVEKFEIIFGERRFRASKNIGLATIPCEIVDIDEEKALDWMLTENLHRLDILPSEEADIYKKLIDERSMTVHSIGERYGKTPRYIYNRLALNHLMPEIVNLLNESKISMLIAVEISRFEYEIQKKIHDEHLNTDQQFNSWLNLGLNAFKEKVESKYTTLLSRYLFDKNECNSCQFNSELRSLFPEIEKSRCTQPSCLIKKHENNMVESCINVLKDEKLDIYATFNDVNSDVVSKIQELGIEVSFGDVFPVPPNPEKPDQNDFKDNENGFVEAMAKYNSQFEEHTAYNEMLYSGHAKKVIRIGMNTVTLGYVLITKDEPVNDNSFDDIGTPPEPVKDKNGSGSSAVTVKNNPDKTTKKEKTGGIDDIIAKLQKKDAENKANASLGVLEGVKKLLKEKDIKPLEVSQFDELLMFFLMIGDVNPKNLKIFGLKDSSMSDDLKLSVVSKLTQEQKNTIILDFILKGMMKTSGLCKKSGLLIEFAKAHFPSQFKKIEDKFSDIYEKQRKLIDDQIQKSESMRDDKKITENEEVKKVA